MFLWCDKIVTPAVNNLMANPMTGGMQNLGKLGLWA